MNASRFSKIVLSVGFVSFLAAQAQAPAALPTAFDMQLPEGQKPLLPVN
jgi:hypothetical protein